MPAHNTMTYKLAKALKDAEFPQVPWLAGEGMWFDELGNDSHGDPFDVYIPSLSELIEACGKSFGSVGRYEYGRGDRFYATMRPLTRQHAGATPEEATAKMWLALNKK